MRVLTLALPFVVVDESVQPGGSFKWRGMSAYLRQPQAGGPFVTFSSGNHGIAVSIAGRLLCRPVTVVVPVWAETAKVNLLKNMGSKVIYSEGSALACERTALRLAEEHRADLIHPFRSSRQIEGYTSLWAELAEVLPQGADVIVPVGAGGLLASGVLHSAQTNARWHLIGAEPARCASLSASVATGKTETIETRSLFAPGLNVNEAPEEVLELLRSADDLDLYQVSDSEMAAAAVLMDLRGFAIDPAAAAGVACALFRVVRRKHKDLVVIITGRGARVSAERLREQGLLEFSDVEIGSFARSVSGVPTMSRSSNPRQVGQSGTHWSLL